MKKRLIIIGAGGHGKVAADIAIAMSVYNEIAFIDDNQQGTIMGLPIIGSTNEVSNNLNDTEFFVAIGNNRIRKEKIEELEALGAEIATLIHPGAVIGQLVDIEKGSIIMPGAVVNVETKLGKGSIINTGATVDHECIIGECVHISVGTHIAGRVRIDELTMIGAGAVIINNVNICDNCMISAGAVVIKDIFTKGTYVGVPAKMI